MRSRYHWINFALVFVTVLSAKAQSPTDKKIIFSGYAEFYFSQQIAAVKSSQKPAFIFNHKQNNEPNINLAFLKAAYTQQRFRGNLAVMSGNYAHNNLAAEPAWARVIFEANAGVKLSSKKNIWLDAGVMPSHIGFESAISADCWTLTRSLLAENSPYFETGVKASYTSDNQQWYIAALYLNGWQKIVAPFSIKNPSFGTQIQWKPIKGLVVNYSTFLGANQLDSFSSFRHFHNFYVQLEPTKKWSFLAGFDIGSDKYSQKNYGTWHSAVGIIGYAINPIINLAARAEYYSDANQVLLRTGNTNGFKAQAFSSNVDVRISKNYSVRMEGRLLQQKHLSKADGRNNFFITTNFTARF